MNNNYIKTTPDFVYAPPQPFINDFKKNESKYNIYIDKFKTAVYCFVLFLLLSSCSGYKILNIFVKLFNQKIEIMDDECSEPSILGRVIMAFIMAIIIFIM